MKKNYLFLALVAILSVFGLSSCTNEDIDDASAQQEAQVLITRFPVITVPQSWTLVAEDVLYEQADLVGSVIFRDWYVPEYKGSDTKESITAAIGQEDGYQEIPFGQRVVSFTAKGLQYLTPEGTTVYITTEHKIDYNPVIHNGGEVR